MFASKDQFFTRTSSGYQITKSLRFRSSASANLNRTFTTPTSAAKWTWSGWVKLGAIGGTNRDLFATSSTDNEICLGANSTADTIGIYMAGAWRLVSTQVFRDPSSWYHFIVVFDGGNATASNRLRVYVNGSEITTWTTDTRSALSSSSSIINTAVSHRISSYDGTINFFDGYLAEVNFIDGQALTPSSFGAYDANGVWSPSKYTGTYGANGFYLAFTDNSGATATTIGKDYSGNGNNWTPNNISVTSGVTYDSMIDSPTNAASGTQPVGNYCTLNPLVPSTASRSIVDGNLKHQITAGTVSNASGSCRIPSTGKWYFEILAGTVNGGSRDAYGICTDAAFSNFSTGYTTFASTSTARIMNGTGNRYPGNTAYGGVVSSTNIVGVAVDMDNNALYFAINNTWQNSGVPTSGASKTGAAFTDLSGYIFYPYSGVDSGVSVTYDYSLNCGQRPFTYTPPSGYQALCTSNLAAPTIANGAKYMAATTYTGTGATQTIANTVNSANFQPDLVWIKSRSAATNNNLFDAIRGTTNYLISNSTAANASNANTLTAFGSTGFTLGSDASSIGVNVNTATYVGWQWLAGAGTTSSNTNGSITSTVCVNTTSGFSVVTYTGTGANATVGHGLGVAPSMVIVKQRTAASTTNWAVWHTSIANTNYLLLNTTAASTAGATYWNSTTPTSSVFSLGSAGDTNTNTGTYVAYCFASITGYSAFGSYTGNASTDGTFIYTGFRPRFILHKASSTTSQWMTWDTSRNTYNVLTNAELLANSANAEGAGAWGTQIDILSNGFKFRGSDNSNFNYTGITYIYAAFAENPFNYSRAR